MDRRTARARVRALAQRGVYDRDLEYLREPGSFRCLRAFDEAYSSGHGRGLSPTAVALQFKPIRIELGHDGKRYLEDGRHRLLSAIRHGATAIRADVIQRGPKFGMLWREEMVVPLLDRPEDFVR